MGPLASAAQLKDVRAGIEQLAAAAEVVLRRHRSRSPSKGYFVAPTLLVAADADGAVLHELEVFGPGATLMPYDGTAARAAELVGRGQGGLVSSVYANDTAWTEDAGARPRALARPDLDRLRQGGRAGPARRGRCCRRSIHGGPGRAGGGEELGGLRGLSLYMQRVALQGYKGLVESTFGS